MSGVAMCDDDLLARLWGSKARVARCRTRIASFRGVNAAPLAGSELAVVILHGPLAEDAVRAALIAERL